MTQGTLYGIGVGPGDPELMTVAGANLLGRCLDVFVPKARIKADSLARDIAARYVGAQARVVELVFPMTDDDGERRRQWAASAGQVTEVLRAGSDACFLTLGDPMLYSTWIYLMRAVCDALPAAKLVTVPGVPAMCAAAALTGFPLGEGTRSVTVVPTSTDLAAVARALDGGGTVVLMKLGRRLPEVLDILEERGLMGGSVFVSRAGLPDQRIELDPRRLRGCADDTGYLSIMLARGRRTEAEEAT